MLFNHFKTAWRNLIRHPFSSVINIIGLSTGITCCLFISLYVWSEINADSIHVRKENIYRVNQLSAETRRGGTSNSYPLSTSLQNEYPDIKKIVRMGQDNVSIRADRESYFYEEKFYWTDSTFFDVFSFRLVKGNPATALKDPYSLVITQAMAEKYFKDNDPLGKVVELKIYDGDRKFNFTITGVVENPSKASSIQFEFLAPMRAAMIVYPQFENFWNLNWLSTYALIENINALPSTKKQSAAFFEKYAGKDFTGLELEFQPLSRVHLHSGHVGKNLSDGMVNVYIFSIIGLFIFLLACVNFVNISTARAELRKKEIGVRKALGAFRKQLFSQFMMEAILTAAIVLVLALAATSALQPLASSYIEGTSSLFSAFVLPIVFLSAIILVGIFAGLYPAIFLSGFKPLEALKAKPTKSNSTSSRQVLVVFQFIISIALIAGTLIVNKQVRYIKNADLGFATHQLITIPVDDRALQRKITTIKELMGATQRVNGIAVSGEDLPAQMNNTWGVTWQGLAPGEQKSIDIISIDDDYFTLLQAHFVEGRNLSKSFGADDSTSFVINEAARQMMNVKEAVGKEVVIGGRKGTIVGVVKDIHHYSLHQKVSPVAYFPVPSSNRACSDNLILTISNTSLPSTIASLKQKWETLTQDRPFEYHFVDDDFALSYQQEEKFLSLFTVFSGLAIIIACLGLMGLSSFVVNRRSKEIGIRKVMGASISHIVLMLTKGFSAPILIAFLIAGPGIYFVMNRWLNKFAYKVTVDFVLIGLAGLLAWLIAFSFVAFQSWKAARVNPTDTLRNE